MATDERQGPWPDIAIPPGETLAEDLQAMGLTQTELAQRMGRPVQMINEIIKGKKAITPATALELERVLGTPAHFWLNLERDYQFNKARLEDLTHMEKQAGRVSDFPYAEMARLGWVARTRKHTERARELLHFFGVADLGTVETVQATAWRKARGKNVNPYALAAWRRKAQIEAHVVETGAFDGSGLTKILPTLRTLTRTEIGSAFNEAQHLLRDNGITLVCVPHLQKTYVQGATWWVGPGRSLDRAVIALTVRYKSHDILWFTLLHEIGHLVRHGKREVFIDLENGEKDEREQEADRFAADLLIPPGDFRRLATLAPFRDKRVRAFAEEIGVDAGIVVGRLQHERLIPHDRLNGLRRKVTLEAP